MRLSTKGRYAVMAMADLARNGRGADGATRAVSLAEIAARQEISLSYLEQLFARLRKGGLVQSVRGDEGQSHGDEGRNDQTFLAGPRLNEGGQRRRRRQAERSQRRRERERQRSRGRPVHRAGQRPLHRKPTLGLEPGVRHQ